MPPNSSTGAPGAHLTHRSSGTGRALFVPSVLLATLGSLTLAGCAESQTREPAPPAVVAPLALPPPPPPEEPPAKCVVPADEPTPDAIRRAVEQAMQGYAAALRDGPPRAVAARYTSDGELQLPELAPLRGRKAIIDFLTPLASTSRITSVKMHTDLLEAHGPIAMQWGTYEQDAGERGKPPDHFHGRYAASWHLEADGVWRLSRLMMQPIKSESIR